MDAICAREVIVVQDKEPPEGRSTSSPTSCGSNKKGIFSKLKETVSELTNHKIDLHVPKTSLLLPHRKGGTLLEDSPSKNKEPFWKSRKTRRHESSSDSTERKRSTMRLVQEAQQAASNLNMASAAHVESDEFHSFERTQRRSREASIVLVTTDNYNSCLKRNKSSDDLLSHLQDSELPPSELSFSTTASRSSLLLRSSSEESSRIRGGTSNGRRGGCIGDLNMAEKEHLRRSSNLLQLDNVKHYGGFRPFGNQQHLGMRTW
eukprot:CAMPEP_0119011534 /NCGR_PEP_ID=MMETSP1176-20130426/5742_1 /TAXON_ID=265551 /ORGANISM="Synedropsis recta cf, Strain CCMP1620" /LENGTH=261 /DNA_ID=CAMNT_0006964381 /DNA_START=143 /DNA_END=928 /DNA_ORIENTATION=-